MGTASIICPYNVPTFELEKAIHNTYTYIIVHTVYITSTLYRYVDTTIKCLKLLLCSLVYRICVTLKKGQCHEIFASAFFPYLSSPNRLEITLWCFFSLLATPDAVSVARISTLLKIMIKWNRVYQSKYM